ncbi:substrate-binding domain-containing protein [Marinomonas sp. BSi20584]|uniref:substrate-binding domain-containing protein n=1 Tax=Marinomonas sp. BSi20584 TaxID=1594462 RepID=UPI000C1E6FD0|nr:substrate-binding domain-containing protein [Marinomonas sp. BSi20584]PJE53833.1 hypothetical protein TY87_18730 [Marinomonas sp. BSi20584]
MNSPARILAPAAFSSALDEFAKRMEGQYVFEYGPATGVSSTSITSRIEQGDSADFVILPMALAHKAIVAGHLKGVAVPIFASTVAFCVSEASQSPDLSSDENLWQALLKASSIGISAAGSGRFFRDELLPKLLRKGGSVDKVVEFSDRSVGAAVAEGLVDIGFQQKAELLDVQGIKIIDKLTDLARNDTWLTLVAVPHSQTSISLNSLADEICSVLSSSILRAHGLTPIC